MLSIRATDHDGQYAFGLTGSDIPELLEELGIEATYQYDEPAGPEKGTPIKQFANHSANAREE